MTEQVPRTADWGENELVSHSRLRLFESPELPVSPRDAIRWWEERRIAYNLIMFATAIIAFGIFFVAILASGDLPPGEDAAEPLGLIAGAIVFPFAINICYTLGWVIEVVIRAFRQDSWRRFGPVLLGIGLTFSVLLVSSPAIGWVIVDLGHLLRAW